MFAVGGSAIVTRKHESIADQRLLYKHSKRLHIHCSIAPLVINLNQAATVLQGEHGFFFSGRA